MVSLVPGVPPHALFEVSGPSPNSLLPYDNLNTRSLPRAYRLDTTFYGVFLFCFDRR